MSLDRSLKTAGSLTRHRNVLTRPEKIAKLQEKDKFNFITGDPMHLPKVGNRKVVSGGKTTKKAEGEAVAGAAAPAAAGGAGAAKGGAAKAGAGAAKPAAGAAAKAAPAKGAAAKK